MPDETHSGSAGGRPPRRPRYAGTHPRHFAEKYKEHAPDKYPADVARIVDQGRTPAGSHRPIMVREILDVLQLQPGQSACDCTLGYGGHARELLARVQPGGRLLAVDVDPLELPRTESRLRELGHPPESLIVRRMNFATVSHFIAETAPGGVDALLADLGVSSMQIDDPARGFSFKSEGPLDMRMNPAKGRSAMELLSRVSREELQTLLQENADEPHARELAKDILLAHGRSPLATTQALAGVIRATVARVGRRTPDAGDDSVRRVFQALRIVVNEELAVLDTFLKQLPDCLKPGGRVAVLTFHSGEDRRVKQAFRDGLRGGIYSAVASDVIRASPSEQRANPRSASAKLRWAIRTDTTATDTTRASET